MDIDPYVLRIGAIRFIILVCSLVLHEWGHAYAADRLGDDTPRREGRVTLNPLAHIDIIGTIIIPLLGAAGFFGSFAMIGWAKPVYTNPANFRRGYLDQSIVTIAGPAMNILLALFGTIGVVISGRLGWPTVDLFGMVLTLNVALTVFNLLPIPPLDGSKFLIYWGGMREETYVRVAMYGSFALLLLINVPVFRDLVMRLILWGHIPFLWLIQRLT